MKLVRFGNAGAEKPGILDKNGTIRDLSAHVDDLTPASYSLEMIETLSRLDPETLPAAPAGARLGPPISRPGHFIAIGLNYADHAEEAGLPIPEEPVIFSKAPSSLSGPHDPILYPKNASKLDWEVELALIIGKTAWQVGEEEALSHVAGYTICNDVSERKWQIEGTGQWIKGKSGPTFGPLGPWLVTADEVPDPQSLDLFLEVNGQRYQSGSTSTMIFPVKTIVSFLSQLMVLEPGDVIITGTPPGVGLGMKPPVFLTPGDEVRLGISGLGEQHQKVVAA